MAMTVLNVIAILKTVLLRSTYKRERERVYRPDLPRGIEMYMNEHLTLTFHTTYYVLADVLIRLPKINTYYACPLASIDPPTHTYYVLADVLIRLPKINTYFWVVTRNIKVSIISISEGVSPMEGCFNIINI